MNRLVYLLLTSLIVAFLSCRNERHNAYAIKDFRKSLQPFLLNIVSKGIVTYHDSSDIKSITDGELICLGRSENPVLRATALEEMLNRRSFSHFDVVTNHLDDTAIIAIDAGEFGIWFQTVSDYTLQNTSWETQEAKNKTIEQVLTKHNYLRSAYTILSQLEPQENYYSYIRDMAIRPRRIDPYEGYELGFDDIEYALYGLAKFRKKEDIQSIKGKLMKHVWELSDISFRMMKEYPDTAYLDVLQLYHRRQFYKFSGNRPYGFSGIVADKAAPEDFIEALVIQQNDRSANLLDTMLTYLPQYPCMPDKEIIFNAIIEAIWEHPCPAYINLREKIKSKAEQILKDRISIPLDPGLTAIDTIKKKFYWYS